MFGTASCSGHLLDVDYLLVSDYSSHRVQPFARRWTKTPASAMAWITSFVTLFFLVFVGGVLGFGVGHQASGLPVGALRFSPP